MKSHLRFAAAVALLAPCAFAQITIPPHAAVYNGFSRGYNFTANTNFIIAQLDLPPEAFQAGDTAGYMVRVNGIEVLRSIGNAGAISTNVLVNTGDVVDVIGNWSPVTTGNFTAHNSYGNGAPFATTILGVPHTLNRTGWQWDIADPAYLSGTYLAPTSGQLGRVLLYANPQSGLFPNFTATPTSGPTPLVVNFTDTTFTSDPSGVQSWAWDLNGDSVIDSNAQNPSFTYTTCGPYDVTLTVTDTQHPAATITKPDFIFADPQLVVGANFSASVVTGVSPLNVSFTDTSTGNPTTWSWDLNGDSIPDSALQNPSFTYTLPGFYTVTLTAANACFPDTETKANYIHVLGATSNTLSPEVLEYQFNEYRGSTTCNTASTTLYPSSSVVNNSTWQSDPGRTNFNGNEPGAGCLGYRGATGSGWVNAGGPLIGAGSFTIMFWLRRDVASTGTNPFGYVFGDVTFRGFCAGAAVQGITFRGSAIGNVDSGFTVTGTPGVWQHLAVVVDDIAGQARWYDNGVAGPSVAFTAGTFAYTGTRNFAVGAQGDSGLSPAGTNYAMDDFRFYARALTAAQIQTELASENPTTCSYDTGCADSNGYTPRLAANGAPNIGNATFALLASGMEPGRPVAIYVGVSTHLGGFLPLDLAGSGLFNVGCALSVTPDVALNFGSGGGSVTLPSPIPIDPTLAGGHAYSQLIHLSSGPLSAVSAPLDGNVEF